VTAAITITIGGEARPRVNASSISLGFVGYDKDDHFIHYCHCGKWGSFGYGVSLRDGKFGSWYCREHRP
jgi:hypothetical protein